MLFASTALAARIERADARLMSESASAAARRRPETRAFAERGAPVQVELSYLADPQIGALLTRRGYTLENFENVQRQGFGLLYTRAILVRQP
jgi:hypothetical protein